MTPLRAALALWLILAAASLGASAQEKAGARLTLSPGSGLPDSEVSLPLYLWDSGSTLSSVAVTLVFPGSALSFERAELTVVSEAVGAELKIQGPASGPETTRVILEIGVPTKSTPGETLPDGPLAYLTFRIAKEAVLGGNIAVVLETKAVADPQKPAESLESPEALITVQSQPLTACYFYMH